MDRGSLGALVAAVALALAFASLAGCSRPKDVCGPRSAVGGGCSPEGASCSPAPVGSGWSHSLVCQGGTWQELEIAPLPTPPATSASTTK